MSIPPNLHLLSWGSWLAKHNLFDFYLCRSEACHDKFGPSYAVRSYADSFIIMMRGNKKNERSSHPFTRHLVSLQRGTTPTQRSGIWCIFQPPPHISHFFLLRVHISVLHIHVTLGFSIEPGANIGGRSFPCFKVNPAEMITHKRTHISDVTLPGVQIFFSFSFFNIQANAAPRNLSVASAKIGIA